MSQEQLADQAGISLTTVTRLERQPRAARRSRILGRLAPEIGEDPSTLARLWPTAWLNQSCAPVRMKDSFA